MSIPLAAWASGTGREATLALLAEASNAVSRGDRVAFARTLDALSQWRDAALADGVARVVQRVHNVINELNLDSRLTRLAGSDIPDARNRLDYVVRMTEQAAHRTLDLVDDSRRITDEMTRELEVLKTAHADMPGSLPATVERCVTELRANLSALAQAQEYQDLSGQIVNRVITLVRDVENALTDLLHIAGTDIKFSLPQPNKGAAAVLPGPVVPGSDTSSASQLDADDLLADLGL